MWSSSDNDDKRSYTVQGIEPEIVERQRGRPDTKSETEDLHVQFPFSGETLRTKTLLLQWNFVCPACLWRQGLVACVAEVRFGQLNWTSATRRVVAREWDLLARECDDGARARPRRLLHFPSERIYSFLWYIH